MCVLSNLDILVLLYILYSHYMCQKPEIHIQIMQYKKINAINLCFMILGSNSVDCKKLIMLSDTIIPNKT